MKTALLVIDYINGIINGSCKNYAAKYPIVENTNKLIAHFRKNNLPIYFIRLAFDENYVGLPYHSKLFNLAKQNNKFKLGQEDTEFIQKLDFKETDVVLNKIGASPFHCDGKLTLGLQSEGVEKLIFTGVATDNAINLGVRQAHDVGYYTVIAKDACGASSEDFHNWSLLMLDKIANEIVETEEYLTQA